MSSLAPIVIPSSPASSSSSIPSSPTSTLYVPLHKRSSIASSSRSFSSRSSSATRCDTPDEEPPLPFVYSRDSLLNLANSPLSRFTAEERESLRVAFPELITNRKQRKALEYFNHIAQFQNVERPPQPAPQPRRTRPVGRAPERRRNAAKVVDEAYWRGRTISVVPISV